MKKLLLPVLFILIASASQAQQWVCSFVEVGTNVVEQTLLLTETPENFTFQAMGDSVDMGFLQKLEKMMPAYDQILDIDFGATTFVYTIDGNAIVFRKCKSAAENKPVADNNTGPGKNDQ